MPTHHACTCAQNNAYSGGQGCTGGHYVVDGSVVGHNRHPSNINIAVLLCTVVLLYRFGGGWGYSSILKRSVRRCFADHIYGPVQHLITALPQPRQSCCTVRKIGRQTRCKTEGITRKLPTCLSLGRGTLPGHLQDILRVSMILSVFFMSSTLA